VRRASPSESSPNRPSRRWLVRCSRPRPSRPRAPVPLSRSSSSTSFTSPTANRRRPTSASSGRSSSRDTARHRCTGSRGCSRRHLVRRRGRAKWTLRRFGVEMTGAWLRPRPRSSKTQADLRNRLASILERGELPDERREEILNAFTVGERPVETSRPTSTTSFSRTASVEENLDRIGSSRHTRFPLIEDEPEIRRYHLRPDDRRPDRRPPSQFGHVRRPRDAADNALC